MPKKTYKSKLKSADKKLIPNSLSELTDAVIQLLDRQDKYDDAILKLSNKQERLQSTFDNLIEVLNTNSKDSIYFTEELKLMGNKMNELQTFVRLKSATNTDTIDKLEQRINYHQNLTNEKLISAANGADLIKKINEQLSLPFFKRLFNKI